ncbi:MAG: glycosyltransferase [Epsilonproteobacteria bacterium]|nr:MAG: glycosyltransferase [Campylobacterota bacterium]
MGRIYLSVIIPVYNEEENILPLYRELRAVLGRINKTHEIIFVDDGSTDNTRTILTNLMDTVIGIKTISFIRHLGKSAALDAGFKAAKGEVIVTMDGDLQDDPNEIPRLLSKINKGFDLVVGWKQHRQDPFTKKIPSKIFNTLIQYMTGVQIHDSNCCLKAYKKKVVKDLEIYGDMHRYIPSLAHWMGYTVTEIKVNHRPRKHGKSKYGTLRLFNGVFDLLTVRFLMSFINQPLHLFGWFGLLSLLAGAFTGLYTTYLKYILHTSIGDRPLLIITILLILMGIQFISIGLLGELIIQRKRQ